MRATCDVFCFNLNKDRPTKSSLTIVIKVGTSSICDEKTHYPLLGNLSRIVETIILLKEQNHRVVLVTSAAVGTGLRRLNLQEKPKRQALVQAIAAVGQVRLMSMYDDLFGRFNQTVAQLLLTKNDLSQRSQYLNAVNCIEELLDMGVVPIVNENDTISYSEIKFGDNDTLSAITAGMVKADYLFLLTDVDCLYTDNPRTNPSARPIIMCDDMQQLKSTITVTSPGSSLGTGGMVTKLVAADLATAAGVITVITRGAVPENILPIIESDDIHTAPLHTRFLAKRQPLVDRTWWILHGLHTAGTLVVDHALAKSMLTAHLDDINEESQGISNTSIFAQSVIHVEGNFVEHQAVQVVIQRPLENGIMDQVAIAKGMVNFSSAEIIRIMRARQKNKIDDLGFDHHPCIIDKENMAVSS
ncbi:glutamate 5-kinase [Absidia repens]|uniref:Glutamate 5-kinase n=1 Tax=Absidia repens TaxID=90262 RepID=A0A1X2I814_9FUNG|nr:glutamate 5-kinase [Absidia repens]